MKTTDFAVIAFVLMAITSTQELSTIWLTSLFVLSGCVWIFAECCSMAARLIRYVTEKKDVEG